MSSAGYRAWGIAFAVAGAMAFAFRPVWVKLAYGVPGLSGEPVSPVTILFLRMTLALPFFAAIGWWLSRQSGASLNAREWAAVAGLGFLGYYLASFLDMIGLQWIGAGLARLILFLYPTIVLLLSFMFLGKRPGPREIAALIISYAGITLVVSNQFSGGAEGGLFLLGALLVFVSSICYATYLVAGSELIRRVGSMRFTAYTMIVSTLPAVLQFFVLEPVSALELPAQVWWYAVILASVSTVLPAFLVAEALKRIGANHFALIGAIGPVTTMVAGAVGLDEPFTWLQVVGGLLVISGVLLVSLKRS